jgi:hypothetical protein
MKVKVVTDSKGAIVGTMLDTPQPSSGGMAQMTTLAAGPQQKLQTLEIPDNLVLNAKAEVLHNLIRAHIAKP